MSNNISAIGFNSEYLDSALDSYHLGNGYRAYNPTIMQFTAPDDMSPFGAGGINPYMYCSCDPINNTDPTGHFLGLTLSIGGAIALFNMVSPLPIPESLTVEGVMEATITTVINLASEMIMPGVGGEIAIGAEHTAEAALSTTIAHDAEKEAKNITKLKFNQGAAEKKLFYQLKRENEMFKLQGVLNEGEQPVVTERDEGTQVINILQSYRKAHNLPYLQGTMEKLSFPRPMNLSLSFVGDKLEFESSHIFLESPNRIPLLKHLATRRLLETEWDKRLPRSSKIMGRHPINPDGPIVELFRLVSIRNN